VENCSKIHASDDANPKLCSAQRQKTERFVLNFWTNTIYRLTEYVNFPFKNPFHRFSKYIEVSHYGHLLILEVSAMSPTKCTFFFYYLPSISFVYVERLVYITGHAVTQLVEALRYKPESRDFDSRRCNWNFS